jgi:CRISPR-associated exonuclease Cas4
MIPFYALNTYVYCRRRFYYEYILHEWEDNYHTIEGELQHKRVHQVGTQKVRGRFHNRSVEISSGRLGLYGIVDLIEKSSGAVFPVEYKKGRMSDWKNDQLQLCAQALVLEEQLGIELEVGYIFYLSSRRRMKISFTPELRRKTLQTAEELRLLTEKESAPPPHWTKKRCEPCSIKDICLPQEIEIMRMKL